MWYSEIVTLIVAFFFHFISIINKDESRQIVGSTATGHNQFSHIARMQNEHNHTSVANTVVFDDLLIYC